MSNRPHSGLRRALVGLFILMWAMVAVTAFLFFQWRSERATAALEAHADALPVLMPAPDFTLTNRDGRTVERSSLEGQPWVADFIFTTCPGVCPVLTRRMKELSDELPPDRVRLVSISVDPARDTPEALEAYAQKNGAGDNWLFLTGDEADIERVIKDGFKLVYDPTPQEIRAEAIVHSNRFVLVDADGQIRGYYDAFNDDDLATLRRDLASLLAG
ncbi:MAG: SCO family protein [Acidobacteriota bacterium]